jgi:hypothetical protein
VLAVEGPFTADELQELRRLLALVKGLVVKRNRFVHSHWYYVSIFDEMHGLQDRRHSDVYEFGVSVDEIARAALEAHEVTDANSQSDASAGETPNRRASEAKTMAVLKQSDHQSNTGLPFAGPCPSSSERSLSWQSSGVDFSHNDCESVSAASTTDTTDNDCVSLTSAGRAGRR